MLERDVVLCSKENGQDTIDLPITRLGNIEDSAEVKTAPESGDYIPVVDTADGGQMKKVPWDDIKMAAGGIPIVTTYTPEGGVDGVDYAADVPGLSAVYPGFLVMIKPHVNSASDTLTLTIAGTKKSIKRPSAPNATGVIPIVGSPLGAVGLLRSGKTYILMYFVSSWLAVTYPIAQLDNASGYLPATKGGTGLNGVPKDNYLVGNNTDPMVAKGPQEVREHIGAAAKTLTVDSGLTAGGWTGSGPYTQTRVVAGLTEDSNAIVGLAQTATAEQREAARDAMLSVIGQTGSSIIVTADGEKPTVNIPIVVTLLG